MRLSANNNTRFGDPVSVTMKINVFWDVTVYSLVERDQCFG
jgi:hypothetical protein